MNSFNHYLSQGNAWLFFPSAILLGALHGLEPGHSKTMMAAFIISVRGTVRQAVLLGLSATISHTAIIWLLAAIGMHYAGRFSVEETEPYFQLITGVIVMGMAAWMFWRIRREQNPSPAHHHDHGDETRNFPFAQGGVELSVFEDGVPPRFQLRFRNATEPAAESLRVTTIRPDGSRQIFSFARKADCFESTSEIPEPHEFKLELQAPEAGDTRTVETEFIEYHHAHDDLDDDAHAREHAADLQKRFANRRVTTGQIILFGLTGGLLPCPSAVAVLLVCMQIKQFSLGFALVLAFSLGLALTLISVGTLAALSVKHASQRLSWLGPLTRRLPYASCVLLSLIGFFVALQGARHLLH